MDTHFVIMKRDVTEEKNRGKERQKGKIEERRDRRESKREGKRVLTEHQKRFHTKGNPAFQVSCTNSGHCCAIRTKLYHSYYGHH